MQTVRSEFARAEANGRSGAEMTEWVRSMERPLLNTQEFLKAAEVHEVRETVKEPQERHEREEERKHALPFED
jgi:hypothetical protein